MKLVLAFLMAATGCTTDLAGSTSDSSNTDTDTSHTFNLVTCVEESWHVWLPLGSAWASMAPSGSKCQLLLGGETENPIYSGGATQTCLFPRLGFVTISVESGGPAHLDSSYCTP